MHWFLLLVVYTWVQKKYSRPVPNNKGLTYFKWTMENTMLLLHECLSKEVWAQEYGDVTCMRADISNSEEYSCLGGAL